MFNDLEIVALRRDCAENGLLAGDTGTIVHVYADGAAYEIEFTALDGNTLAIPTLPADAVRPVRPGEIAQARAVATA